MTTKKLGLLTLALLLSILGARAALAAIDIDRVSSPVIYINAGDGFVGMHAGYQVINNSGADIDDLWVGTENFSGPFISNGDNEDGFVSLGPLADGQTAYAFIYLKATTVTSGETHDVTIYDGVPPALGGVGTQLAAAPTPPGGKGDGSGTQNGLAVQFSLDAGDTISANANKVDTTIVGPNPPELGGVMTVTITGSTGTIGSAAGSIFAGAPSVLAEWPSDSLRLATTSIDMTGGNTLSETDTLFLSGLASANTDYTSVYTFIVTGPTDTQTSLVPINYISSGAQIKHTGNITTTTFPPIEPIENYLVVTKSATPDTLSPGGGTATYTLTLSNSGTIAAELRDIIDTLPTPPVGTITYDAMSAELDGSPYSDSQLTIAGQQLTWLGPFIVPVGGSTIFTYDVTYTGTPNAQYDNSAVGHVALTQIDTTMDTSDDLPAVASVEVGVPPPDTDGDGVADSVDPDDDGDGIADVVEGNGDVDGDGIINALDSDSDGDGVTDNVEAQAEGSYIPPTGNDTDGDGLDDAYDTDNGGSPIVVVNTDGVDGPDYLDADADNDGVPDLIEGHDVDGDGVADVTPAATDADGDGLDDSFDTVAGPAPGNATGSNSPLQNNDGTDSRDWRDDDDDNDGIATAGEDANSNSNFADDDADGDGTPDYLESATADTDGDGVTDQNDPADTDACIPSQFGAGCTTDTDGDGTPDSVEGEFTDSDGDGIPDYQEASNVDTDGDGVNDQDDPGNTDLCIPSTLTPGCAEDTDGDGLTDPDEVVLGTDHENPDTDGDGISDGVETGGDTTVDPGDTDPLDSDSDDDGLADGVEDANRDGVVQPTETDPTGADTDGDGIDDGIESGVTTGVADPDGAGPLSGTDPSFTGDADPATTTNPLDADSDGDGLLDGAEDANGDGQTLNTIGDTGGAPGSGETDPNRTDTDADGLSDGDETNGTGPLAGIGATDPLDTDTDDGGAQDGAEVLIDGTDPTAGNGLDDAIDSDSDGLTDAVEGVLGTDPNDADSDNDGLTDGQEVGGNGVLEPGETDPLDGDSDDDGLTDGDEVNGTGLLDAYSPTDPLAADTDGDGIDDGIEAGVSTDGVDDGASDAAGIPFGGTAPGFVGDADPDTTTDPTNPDSDGDNLPDGAEDLNGDGQTVNTIGDSTSSGTGETDPNFSDTDSDGLSDGDEVNGTGPLAGVGATDPLDADTDDGGTQDGTELLSDGTNPVFGNAADDAAADPDDDGLSNAQEALLGTDPTDADTDNDGIDDGTEVGNDATMNPGDTDPLDADSDDDGLPDGAELVGQDGSPNNGDETDPLNADSDNDGVADGIEVGATNGVSGGLSDGDGVVFTGTDTGVFMPDADPTTTTDPTDPDSDDDGQSDGAEDANGNGAVSNTIGGTGTNGSGETDPNSADTDGDGLRDGDEINGTGPLAVVGPTDPLDTDTDDGGTEDGAEALADGTDPVANPADDAAADPDADGLSNAQEGVLGTDPNDADTDNDGIDDGDEVGNDATMNPGDTDPLDADSDDDGLSDGAEVVGADGLPNSGDETMPVNPDSDGDGLTDGLESGITMPVATGTSDGNGTPYSGTDTGSPNFDVDTDPASTTDPTDPDTDNDGLQDGVEDANSDGSTGTVVIGGTGTGGSGETNPNNRDSDGDGLTDGNEADGIGVLGLIGATDPLDTDTDDGGVDDATEVLVDSTDPTSGNGVDDRIDSDGDTVPDASDSDPFDPCAPNFPSPSCPDSDADGAADFGTPTGSVPVEPDLAADIDPCVPSNSVPACDTDNDGISDGDEVVNGTNPNDPDSDGDGIPDGAENSDADGDGINDGADADSDNDGIPDAIEAGPMPAMPLDTDNDGAPDFVDPDSDNDGIPDSVEGSGDADGDTVPNYRDPDSDGDGIPDAVEDGVSNGVDSDGDNIDDGYDVDATAGTDVDNDGVDDAVLPDDTDGDEKYDYLDFDADNDGIPDNVEADLDPLADGDGDQINDVYDVDATLGADIDGDGIDDAISPTDTDTDTVPDYLDLDADNDSVPDVTEGGGFDTDGNGIIDLLEFNEGTLTMPTDSDFDGIGDWREVDSDNDGTNDIAGTSFVDQDGNGDGMVDDMTDSDGDGVADVVDPSDGFGTTSDSDNDGIPDSTEGNGDTDGDGIPDLQDPDSDNDGIPDSTEAGPDPANPVDTDGDGVPDYTDTDSDNDGIADALEGNNDFDMDGIPDYVDVDDALETAVRGSGVGSLGWLFLLALITIALWRRAQRPAVMIIFVAGIGIQAGGIRDARADSLCGHYTAPGDDRYYYDGTDPDRDEAGFAACWYGGLGAGYSYVSPDEEAQNFLHDTDENHDFGWHLYVGRQFTPRWFAELKYADLGEAGITNRNPAIAAAFPDAAITYKVPSLMAGYQWRVTKHWKPFAKFGVSAINNSAKGGPIPFEKQTSVQVAFGAGLKYDFGRSPWSLRGDIDWYDRDAWYLNVSVARFFGGEPDDAPRAAPRVDADTDGDGVADDDDQCPGTPAEATIDGAGCPVPLDEDSDGVPDFADSCPGSPPGILVDQRGCAVDSDGDGVRDSDDECPNSAPAVPVDIRGCEITDEIRLPNVKFETNSDRLRPGSEQVLDDVAATLNRNPGLIVEVAGHTDNRGDSRHNLGLSERRAKTVRDYLISRGVDEDRLHWRGYGEAQPIADNAKAEGRESNRRVVLRILQR